MKWTPEDSFDAIEEGWEIFTSDHDPGYEEELVDGQAYGHRPFELQVVEERTIFRNGDPEAWRHVCRRCAEGSALHTRALLFLAQESVAEFLAIYNYWREYVSTNPNYQQG